jgi:hypothetical protein
MKKLVWPWMMALITGYGWAQSPKRFDVVIHELFPDPTPQIGLPNSEFIELRNISNAPINLRNWKLTDGSSTATIASNYVLQADSCVAICPTSALAAFTALGPAIGVSGFPSLNNDADVISLLSPDGRVVHAVAYETSWYRNAVKSDGGWTLEMIDVKNLCGESDNWMASSNAAGGTPGKRNSVEGDSRDERPPALLRTYAIDSITIAALFDESLDSGSAAIPGNYRLSNGVAGNAMAAARALPVPPLFRQVNLALPLPLMRDSVYMLTASNITDCAGNSIGMLNTARVGLPSRAAAGDIVINEVLFNPTANGTDYIEFYNQSNKVLDASGLHAGSRNISGGIVIAGKLSKTPLLVFPGDYIVITENTSLVQTQYVTKYPMNLLTVDQLPSLPDDKGNIVLLNTEGLVIDELSYAEQWHFPLIANREGVALERIDARQPTQQKDNWTSAASDAGFGTPGYRNSQYHSGRSLQGSIEIAPAVFSPDNDGHDDWCFIHYNLGAANNVATITVFDINGNIARNVCSNATLSGQGAFRWDGLDNKGSRLGTGAYIVLTELLNLQGDRKIFKNTVTLARRF